MAAKESSESKKGVFENWLKTFTALVFTQSFHAVFMVFLLQMMSEIVKETNSQEAFDAKAGVLAIVSIAGIWALIKLEKLVKSMFGISDSKLLGGVGDNFAKSLGAISSGINLAKRTAEPFGKYKDQKRKVDRLRNEKAGAHKDMMDSRSNLATTNAPTDVSIQESSGTTSLSTGNSTSNRSEQNSGSSSTELTDAINKLVSSLDKQNANTQTTFSNQQNSEVKNKKDVYNAKSTELNDAERDLKKLNLQRFARAGSTVASLSVGIGATDTFESGIIASNLIDMPLDAMTDKRAGNVANAQTYKATKDEKYLDEIQPNVIKEAAKSYLDLGKAMKDLSVPTGLHKEIKQRKKNLEGNRRTDSIDNAN